MKFLTFLCSLLLMQGLMAQSSKFGYEVELGAYFSTPISSSETPLAIRKATTKLGYDLQFNLSYQVQKKLALTIGAGLLSVGDRTIHHLTKLPITKRENIQHFYYLKIPIGAKYTLGQHRFFIHPSLNINIFHHHQSFLINHLENGQRSQVSDFQLAVQPANSIMCQASLNIGRTFNAHNFQFSAGVKTYYALTPIKSGVEKPWYGLGVFLSCELGN